MTNNDYDEQPFLEEPNNDENQIDVQHLSIEDATNHFQNLEEYVDNLYFNFFRLIKKTIWKLSPFLGPFLLLFILWSSLVWLYENEQAVIYRFGHVNRVADSTTLKFPWPIEHFEKAKIELVQKVFIDEAYQIDDTTQEIEASLLSEGTLADKQTQIVDDAHSPDGFAIAITKDEQIVYASLAIEYIVIDAEAFILNVDNPKDVLLTTMDAALRHVISQSTFEQITRTKRDISVVASIINLDKSVGTISLNGAENEIKEFLEKSETLKLTGIAIQSVLLRTVVPPPSVADRERELTNQELLLREIEAAALAARNFDIEVAQGKKLGLIEKASKEKEARIAIAIGEASKFESVLSAYNLDPKVSSELIYLEAIETVLQRVNLIIIDGDFGSSTLPLIPIELIDDTLSSE